MGFYHAEYNEAKMNLSFQTWNFLDPEVLQVDLSSQVLDHSQLEGVIEELLQLHPRRFGLA